MQDLKLRFQQSTLVFPSQQTHHHHKTLFLSSIDQSLIDCNVQILHFFSPNPHFPPQTTVAAMLKLAIQKVLVPYDFMAGRLKWNHHTARLELHCNSAGSGFVVASSAFSLDELGDLDCPNPGFRQLAVQTLDYLDDQDQPLCVFQLTSFKCGGFAIGISVNHVLLDGSAAGMFLQNLASQAFQDKPLAVIPCNDRHLLAARSPPLVSFPHPEFLNPQLPVLGPPVYGSKQELEIKVFKISSSDINFLKAKAAKQAAADNATGLKITGFNVMAALIWWCRALSLCDVEGDKDRIFTLCYAVDLRSRLNPPLPPE
ncbi:UNVERIFIED_CONTAM: Omega-hydroxypalmitate O-feruloyl transferase [Sesamum latifolium]|uniref:Omega-hydroxypalmitate O-feruloyl transferase n=1 Tax=Sesamum latifolium TaxID=2727402 RepID=A0AAW2VHK0_9LAMI